MGPAFFHCPSCTHVESSSCKQFQRSDLDIKLQCNKCNIKNKVATWKCECKTFWHRCALHSESNSPVEDADTTLKTRKQTAVQPSSRKKANTRPGPDSFEWLQAVDKAKESLKQKIVDDWNSTPTLTLGPPPIKQIRASLLGPILKRRFLDDNSSECVSRKHCRRLA